MTDGQTEAADATAATVATAAPAAPAFAAVVLALFLTFANARLVRTWQRFMMPERAMKASSLCRCVDVCVCV